MSSRFAFQHKFKDIHEVAEFLNDIGSDAGKWPNNAFKVVHAKIIGMIPLALVPELVEFLQRTKIPHNLVSYETYDDIVWEGWYNVRGKCEWLEWMLTTSRMGQHGVGCCRNYHAKAPCKKCQKRRKSI